MLVPLRGRIVLHRLRGQELCAERMGLAQFIDELMKMYIWHTAQLYIVNYNSDESVARAMCG